MAPEEHRGYRISITITRFGDGVRIETEITSPDDTRDRREDTPPTPSDTHALSLLAAEDIAAEALASAKRAVDVLIAERSAISKGAP